MTDKTKNHYKERSKLTKCFCRNGQRKIDCDKVLEKYPVCTRKTVEAKKQYILKMANELEKTNITSQKESLKSSISTSTNIYVLHCPNY